MLREGKVKTDKTSGPQSWRLSPRTFVTTSLGTVGALNAHTGNRWFTLQPNLLEAIVLATVDGQIPFESFCREVLGGTFRMVVDGHTADCEGLTDRVDRASFDRNAEAFAVRLRDLGLLQEYSDATRMVGVRRR